MPSYRKTLSLSFLFKFFHSVSHSLGVPLGGGGGTNNLSETDLLDITTSIHRNISTGTRDNTFPNAQEVVGQPIPHLSGLKHMTGEAQYVDDMPKVGNEAYGALVLSSHAHAKILSVE